MTLEDAFQGFLTSNVKGLHKIVAQIQEVSTKTRAIVESGDLATLKPNLIDLRAKVDQLQKLLA